MRFIRRNRGMSFFMAAILLAGVPSRAGAADGEKRPVVIVTTYVQETQKERKDTRFTVTEWLRIKERMKEMDLWLALLNDPAKKEFRPEMDLAWAKSTSRVGIEPDDGEASEHGDLAGYRFAGQVWLTNLVSSKFGIRTLNVDMGGEGGLRRTGGMTLAAGGSDTSAPATRDLDRQYWSVNFRVFGKNIQDSSLVFKAGRWGAINRVPIGAAHEGTPTSRGGMWGGATMNLYVLPWLGLEGAYSSFGGKASMTAAAGEPQGSATEWGGFIEISLLRLSLKRYAEVWDWPLKNAASGDSSMAALHEAGTYAGVQLML